MDEGKMDGWLRGIGDDDGDDPLQIPRPGRVPERSFWFRIAVSGGGATELFMEKRWTPRRFLGQ